MKWVKSLKIQVVDYSRTLNPDLEIKISTAQAREEWI